jgi:hypothetical protein
MKSPQERRVLAILELIRNREEMTDDDLVQLLRTNLGIGRSASATRAKRYRDKRHAREHHASVTNVTPKRDERNAQTPPVSSPPLHSPSSLPPEKPKAFAVVSEGSDSKTREASARTTTAPRSFEEAMTEPLCSRAALVIGNTTLANLLRVEQWPEVLEVARVWHVAGGRSGEPRVTGGTAEALCKLWAKGFMPGDVLRVARHLPTTDKFRDKVLPSCLTENVVAIALGELAEHGSGVGRAIVQRAREGGAQTAPQPLAASLARFAGGGQP